MSAAGPGCKGGRPQRRGSPGRRQWDDGPASRGRTGRSAAAVRRRPPRRPIRSANGPPKTSRIAAASSQRQPQDQGRLQDPGPGSPVPDRSVMPRRPPASTGGRGTTSRISPPPASTSTVAPTDAARSPMSRRTGAGRTTMAASTAAASAAARASWRSWIICLMASGTSSVGHGRQRVTRRDPAARDGRTAGPPATSVQSRRSEDPLRGEREVGGQRLVQDPEDRALEVHGQAPVLAQGLELHRDVRHAARARARRAGAWGPGPGRRAPSAGRRR